MQEDIYNNRATFALNSGDNSKTSAFSCGGGVLELRPPLED